MAILMIYLKDMGNAYKNIFLIAVLLLAGAFANAQLIPDPVSLNSSPSSPSPGQVFTVQAGTPTIDKNSAFFGWKVDGVSRGDLSGSGKNSIELRAGNVGSATRVEVNVSSSRGGGSASLLVRVSDLSLTWFAETYVPKWYKGKAIPSQNSVVNIVALPHMVLQGSALNPRDLIYTWDLDDTEGALSGIGEQIFSIQTSELPGASHRVNVLVSTPEREIEKRGEAFIVPSSPMVAIYPATPLGGQETRTASGLFVTPARGILDFWADPFFFPVRSKKLLSYQWSVAGFDASGDPEKKHLFSLNTGDRPLSSVPISVSVTSPDQLIASVSKLLTILFE